MGYYTDYTLSVYGSEKTPSGSMKMTTEISPLMEQLIDEEIVEMGVFSDGSIQDSYYVNMKWYNYDDDMKLLSSKFPDMIFLLSGQGEDSEDLWQRYYVNGGVQECYAKIVYDDFDPTKLIGEPVSNVSEKRYSYQN